MSEEPPSFVKNNPWTKILSERGKDSGQPTAIPPESPNQRQKPHATTQDQRQSATEKRGGPPRSKAVIIQRQKQVLELYLRGVDTEGIASELGYPQRTIFKDLAHLKEWLKIHFEKDRIATTNKALAQLDMLWRDLQQIYFSPIPAEGPDPAYRKVMAIDRMVKILQIRTSLTSTLPEPPISASDEETDFSKLTEDDQIAIAKAIKRFETPVSPP